MLIFNLPLIFVIEEFTALDEVLISLRKINFCHLNAFLIAN